MKSIPTSTYRFQFNSAFTLYSLKKIIPYLNTLGISHVYASPVFKAVRGSPHGYDITDPTQINPEIGSRADFEDLLRALQKESLGWIQDIVPNHMAFHSDNLWLMDVLEKGEASAYWGFFDIEWKDTYQSLKGKILTPFLGRFYSQCLEDKEIQIQYDQNGFTVNYADLKLPLKLDTYPRIFSLKKSNIPGPLLGLSRHWKGVSSEKKKLWELYQKDSRVKRHINKNVKIINGRKGNPESFQRLDQLLAKQLFRLSFWKVGAEEINYRRFFNINQLISLRVEAKKIFERTHHLIFDWLKKNKIAGLRIDHIDGLYDPRQYLERLKTHLAGRYLIVEKILGPEEQLPANWPTAGTTGYDFLNYVNGLFVSKLHEKQFNKIYSGLLGKDINFENLVSAKKRLMIGKHMAGDIDNLAHHMKRISRKDRYGRDITSYGLKRALVEVMAYFPRYRTYIESASFTKEERACIEEAVRAAKENNPDLVYELDFIADILLLRFKDYSTKTDKDHWIHFVKRFQQFTGPLMAKGFEDTTLYIYNRLISLNEVGGSPDRFGVSLSRYHNFNQHRQAHWPRAMNATATHDTKRGEDVRARINVLSEIPVQWQNKITIWQKMNRDKKTKLKRGLAPDSNDEYFIYQTLIGGFPFYKNQQEDFKKRLKEYVVKSVREAKVHTAWIQPDIEYEKACLNFIDRLLSTSAKNAFLKDFLSFQKNIADYGVYNSLAQTLLKMTTPGIPDFYQGTELWDFNFVDPDNRRRVDFQGRTELLKDIQRKSRDHQLPFLKEMLKQNQDGRVKLFLIWKILAFRQQNTDIFNKSRYVPLKTTGRLKDHIICFARKSGSDVAITLAPRFLTSLIRPGQIPVGNVWKDTRIILPAHIKAQPWQEIVTGFHLKGGRTMLVRDIFKYFPAALLINRSKE